MCNLQFWREPISECLVLLVEATGSWAGWAFALLLFFHPALSKRCRLSGLISEAELGRGSGVLLPGLGGCLGSLSRRPAPVG